MLESSWELLETLTPKRIHLMRSITRSEPNSIRELALMLERDVKNVWNDLNKLVELELVEFEKMGRSKKPVVKKQVVVTTIEVRY